MSIFLWTLTVVGIVMLLAMVSFFIVIAAFDIDMTAPFSLDEENDCLLTSANPAVVAAIYGEC